MLEVEHTGQHGHEDIRSGQSILEADLVNISKIKRHKAMVTTKRE